MADRRGLLSPIDVQGLLAAQSRGLLGNMPTGEMRSHVPSLRDRIGNMVFDAATAMGLRQSAQRMRQDAGVALDFIPGLGDAVGANEAGRDLAAGNYGRAALGGATTALGAVPGLGDAAAGVAKAIFGGIAAKTANKGLLEVAEKMAKAGADKADIWRETGWFKGADGKWRFEIDDSASTISMGGVEAARKAKIEDKISKTEMAAIIRNRAEKRGISVTDSAESLAAEMNRTIPEDVISLAERSPGSALSQKTRNFEKIEAKKLPMTIGDAVAHGPLFEAYPDLARRPFTEFGAEMGVGTRGAYDADADAMFASKFYRSSPDERSVGLHELQHAVSNREDFPMGGSPEMFTYQNSPLFGLRKSWESAEDAYRRLAGEVEARNVQRRMNMTAAERRATPPWLTEDVPADQQIVRRR